MAYIFFLFRNRIWFALLIDSILLLPVIFVCRRLIVLPFDKLMKPKTEEVIFNGKVDMHELQFTREYLCHEWEFKDSQDRTMRLLIPEATKQTSIVQPKKGRKLKISYYKLSKLLVSWEIIE